MSKYTNEQWIGIFKKIHGNDKYDYSQTDINNKDDKGKIKVICKKHGIFYINPSKHAEGQGCKQCHIENITYTTDKFINKAKKIHNGKYTYDKTNYIDPYTNVIITCPVHGDFKQTPSNHLQGNGCKECMKDKFRLSQDIFLDRVKNIFKDRYNLDKTKYVNDKTNVILTCKKHGDFYITPNHLYRKHGCPKCNMSHMENDIMKLLDENNIKYIYQCNNRYLTWIGLQSIDFYLPEYNIAIECQGIQHFKPTSNIFNQEKYDRTVIDDKRKLDKCKQHNIDIIYYSDVKNVIFPYDVYTDKNKMIEYIINKKGEDI